MIYTASQFEYSSHALMHLSGSSQYGPINKPLVNLPLCFNTALPTITMSLSELCPACHLEPLLVCNIVGTLVGWQFPFFFPCASVVSTVQAYIPVYNAGESTV